MDPEALRAAHDLPVERTRVELPPEDYRRVRAAVEDGANVWAGAVVVDDGHVLLVRNRWSDGWVPPGGTVEDGETPREAAAREVREETGVDATLRDPVAVVEETFIPEGAPGTEDGVSGHYVAFAGTTDDPTLADDPGLAGEGIRAVRWFAELPGRLEHRSAVRRGRTAVASE